MSFFSFLPSPGPVLRDLANCLPSTLGTPTTGRDFSVLDYLSAVLPSVEYGLFHLFLSAPTTYGSPGAACPC